MSHWQKRYTVKSRFEGWKSRLHSWRQDLQSIWILKLRLSFLFFIFFFLSFPPFLLFFSLSLPPLPFFSLSFLSFYCEVQFCFYHWRERTTSPCWHCRFKERTVASTPCLKPSVSWGGGHLWGLWDALSERGIHLMSWDSRDWECIWSKRCGENKENIEMNRNNAGGHCVYEHVDMRTWELRDEWTCISVLTSFIPLRAKENHWTILDFSKSSPKCISGCGLR